MPFYTTEADSTLQNNFVLNDVDVFVMKVEYEGTGVESESVNDVTLTPATAPSWTSNAYQSTVGKNILVTADSSKLGFGKIKSNSTTAVVFDCTNITFVADGTTGANTDWATGTTYSFRIYTADSNYAWGAYFGHCRDVSLSLKEDIIEFKKGVPMESLIEATKERMYEVSGTNFTANADVYRAVWNGSSYGSQTGQNETHFGFKPPTRSFYMLTMLGQNVAGKDMLWQCFKGQFRINGDYNLSAEEFKGVGWTYAVKKDSLRGDAYNAMRLVQTT